MPGVVASSLHLLKLCWQQDKRKTAAAVVLMLANSASAPLVALALKWLTNAVLAGRSTEAVAAAAVTAVLAIMGLTFGHFAHIAYFELSELNVLRVEEDLIALSNGSASLEHHEQPRFADLITILHQDIQQFRTALQALLTGAGILLSIVITAVLLVLLNPLLLLLPVTAVPPLVAAHYAEAIASRAKDVTAGQTRLATHLFELASAAAPAKELRVFGLAAELLARHERAWDTASRQLWRAQRKATLVRGCGQLLFAAGYAGGILLIAQEAVQGHASIGDVILAITLAVQVNQQIAAAAQLMHDLQRMSSAYARLRTVERLVRAHPDSPAGTLPPGRLENGIVLSGVSFRYPGSQRPALHDVNLTLPAGSTVAVVGENGAGKTTLVKLLAGFYRPSQGQILVDGTDLARFPAAEWRARMAAGFQDFTRFELITRETVGIGDLSQDFAEPAVLSALERAHAADVLATLPGGLATPLGTTYTDGAEPSGGQWQKLSLARALMRRQPLLLVLDEPTAALDAEAEHALFDRYAHQARQVARATGGITLFVSHRFSTVRAADLIIVMAEGRVCEMGTHAELLCRGGLYAELYNLQAKAYS
jgi:ATP-binding cassette, subfamily B, bacterial